jgi:hypothetical protein
VARLGAKGDVQAGTPGSPSGKPEVRLGWNAEAHRVVELEDARIAERRQGRLVERTAIRQVAHGKSHVIDHGYLL